MTQARVYAIIEQDSEASRTVVIGALSLFDHTACILNNPGSMHSFISCDFVRCVTTTPVPLDEVLYVSMSLG